MIDTNKLTLALTYDDVMLVPQRSSVLPAETDVSTYINSKLKLNIPIISAAMDTVTESRLAIALAQEGGLGIVHKNSTIEQQAAELHHDLKCILVLRYNESSRIIGIAKPRQIPRRSCHTGQILKCCANTAVKCVAENMTAVAADQHCNQEQFEREQLIRNRLLPIDAFN